MNRKQLLVGSVDSNCPFPSDLGFHLSTDGGSSWSLTCLDVIHSKDGGVYWPDGADPGVAYDRNGVAYISGSYFDSAQGATGFVGFERSVDGVHWSAPAVALAGGVNTIPDFSWLTVDSNAGSPYVNTIYVSAPIMGTTIQVFVAHSIDGGNSWKSVAVGPVDTGRADDRFTNMIVGKDGTVYLTWMHCLPSGPAAYCANGSAYMLLSKSADGGNTWSTPMVLQRAILNNQGCHCPFGDLPNSDVRMSDFPVIGVDNSNGPYAGNLYAAMYSWTGTYMRVGVVRSIDGGRTWQKPVAVAPPSDTHDQFLPWLSVSPTGLVAVSWLDRRNDPANVNYQAFAAISTDGGQSFKPNVQLTTAFSNPNNNGYPGWMGDYTGNTWVGSNFVAAWMDSSNGVDMQVMVGGIRLK
ncbi:MAG: hypothetical protein LAO09_00980 [Acidobacteriia bacterium]|nr:hypothetical protein [Terriglobia bacterium]